jgi:acyl-CoA thioester hydrolase
VTAPPRPFTTRLLVRFPEVDSYGVVWHGHYLAYMEVVRNAVCSAGGLSPAASLAAGYKVPITRYEVKVKSPARLEDELDLEATLRAPRIAKLEIDYAIRRAGGGKLLATGFTEQVVLNPSGELLLTFPGPLKALVERVLRWQEGEETLPAPPISLSS